MNHLEHVLQIVTKIQNKTSCQTNAARRDPPWENKKINYITSLS